MSQYGDPYDSLGNGNFNTYPSGNEQQSGRGGSSLSQSWGAQGAAYGRMDLDSASLYSQHQPQQMQRVYRRNFSAGDAHHGPVTGALQPSTVPDRVSNTYNDPMMNFVMDDTAPWVPHRRPEMFGRPSSSQRGQDLVSQSIEPNLGALGYHNASRAASDGGGPRPAVSDSGYGTRSVRSIAATDHVYFPSDSNALSARYQGQNRLGAAPPLRMRPQHAHQPYQANTLAPPPHNPPRRPRSGTQGSREELTSCSYCGYFPSCASDLKKHLLKHEKNFICTHPGCKRKNGFGTQNDLERHEKSVHKVNINTTRSFRCAAHECTKHTKTWPRLDNFKSHLKRMHPAEVITEEQMRNLIQQSEITPGTSATPPADHDLGHDLAGIRADEVDMPPHDDLTMTPEYPESSNMQGYGLGNGPQGLAAPSQRDDDDGELKYRDAVSAVAMDNGLLDQRSLADQSSRILGDLSQHSRHILSSYNEDQIIYLMSDVAANLSSNTSVPAVSKPGESASLAASCQDISTGRGNSASLSPVEEGTITRAEAVKGLTRLAKVLKQRGVDWIGPSGMHQKSKAANGRTCTYSGCPATFPRECELTKHLKRHTRPYGCTYPRCKKAFGSKSDWKRHETSQHFQLEMWRCLLTRNGKQCAKVCYTKEPFLEHLTNDEHDQPLSSTSAASPISDLLLPDPTTAAASTLPADAIHEIAARFRLGNNGQTRFWCGFCKDIVPLAAKGAEAWAERFRHIDDKHFKRGQRALTWLCFEENKTKRELELSMDRENFEDCEKGGGAEEIGGGSLAAGKKNGARVGGGVPVLEEGRLCADAARGVKRGREEYGEGGEEGRTRKKADQRSARGERLAVDYMRVCCQCSNGPYSSKLYSRCLCDHDFCDTCPWPKLTLGCSEGEIDMDIERYAASGPGKEGAKAGSEGSG